MVLVADGSGRDHNTPIKPLPFRYAAARHAAEAVALLARYGEDARPRVPKNILEARARLRSSGAIIERNALYGGYPQGQFIATREPDVSLFSAEQISLVDSVLYQRS
jgi:hypothetical protein